MKIGHFHIFLALVLVCKSFADNAIAPNEEKLRRMEQQHEHMHEAFEEERQHLEQMFEDAKSKGWNRMMKNVAKASAELGHEMSQLEEDTHGRIDTLSREIKRNRMAQEHSHENEHEGKLQLMEQEHEHMHEAFDEEQQHLHQEFEDAKSKGWNRKMENVRKAAAELHEAMTHIEEVTHKRINRQMEQDTHEEGIATLRGEKFRKDHFI